MKLTSAVMNTKHDIHPIQSKIIVFLGTNLKGKFSDINLDNVPSDNFSFHVRQLIKAGLIQKNISNEYILTDEGKRLFLILDNEESRAVPQPKLSVLVVLKDRGKLLVQKRLKQPFYGFYELPTQRVMWGESIMKTAADLMRSEVGISIQSSFRGLLHKIEKSEEANVNDDKYYAVLEVTSWKGKIKDSFKFGVNTWMTPVELIKEEKSHFDVEKTLQLLESPQIKIEEIEAIPTGY